MKSVQAFIFVAMLFSDAQPYGANMGPFDIIINQITNCASQGEDMFNFVPRTYFVKVNGKKTQLFGVDLSVPFNKEEFEALVVHNHFYQKKNNDYLLMYKFDGEVCKSIDTYCKDTANELKEKLGVKTGDECAIPPGNYTMDNYKFVVNIPTPMLEYGSYKVESRILLGTKVVGCVESYGDVKPKSTFG